MQDQDKDAFTEMMMAAGEVYGKAITVPMIRMYFAALAQMSIEQAQWAMMAHMQNPDNGQFFPKPADLIRQISGTTKQQEAAIEDRAAIAWACIERDIRRIGSYGTLKMEDKQALAAVKAMGGWSHLCASNADELVWRQKEFLRLYEMFERTPVEALPLSLPGRIEMVEHKAQGAKAIGNILDRIANKTGGR